MNNYKIKFKNGRTTTICCDSNEELKSDLVDLTKRFNSEIATINDMPTEKLSVVFDNTKAIDFSNLIFGETIFLVSNTNWYSIHAQYQETK